MGLRLGIIASSRGTAAPSTPIVTTNLISNYDAGNSSSYGGTGSTWFDISGNGNTATAINSPAFVTTNGGAFSMNGTTQRFSMTTNALAGNTTQQVWYKWDGINQLNALSGIGDINSTGYAMILDDGTTNSTTPGNKVGIIVPGFSFNVVPNTTSLSSTNWSNIAITRSTFTGFFELYINGVFVQSTTNSANIPALPVTFYLGPSPFAFAGGLLSIALYYERALSSTEILQNFNAQKSRFGL